MNIAAPMSVSQPQGVCVVHDAADLERFCDPGCAAAIWARDMSTDVDAWLGGLAPEVLPRGRVVVPVAGILAAAEQMCDDAGMPPGRHRDWLIADMAALAVRFATVMKAPYLRLRLEAVTTNACRKFHRDAITGRLVCTYRGTGTQYGTSNAGHDPADIWTVPTGAPVLLRGSLWAPETARDLLHRSPPIEGTGEVRLVLVLDPIANLEDVA